jgi:hypothetical protein
MFKNIYNEIYAWGEKKLPQSNLDKTEAETGEPKLSVKNLLCFVHTRSLEDDLPVSCTKYVQLLFGYQFHVEDSSLSVLGCQLHPPDGSLEESKING